MHNFSSGLLDFHITLKKVVDVYDEQYDYDIV